MAIKPSLKYMAQTDVSAGWPHGKARNVSVPSDGTGTPLEKDWINDLWGWQQALLGSVGILPSNQPDRADASQYLEAIQTLIANGCAAVQASVAALSTNVDEISDRVTSLESSLRRPAEFFINTGYVGTGSRLNLTEALDPTNYYAEDSGRITVDENGYYHVTVTLVIRNFNTAVPAQLFLDLRLDDSNHMTVTQVKDSISGGLTINASTTVHISNRLAQRVNLVLRSAVAAGTLVEITDGVVTLSRER
jgi:hypothetical protein